MTEPVSYVDALRSICEDLGRDVPTVWSFQVGVAKPDAAIHTLACDQVGVDPGGAVFVGAGR